MSSIEQAPSQAGNLYLGLTYEYSSVSDFVTGTHELNDNVRSQRIHSGLLEVSYGLTNRFTLTGVVSLLQQERRTSANDFLRTRGIGDAVLLVKYSLLPYNVFSKRQVSIGGGVKAPLGDAQLTSDGGIPVSPDLWPGTGAWDGIIWGAVSQGFGSAGKWNLYANATYRFTGASDRTSAGDGRYRFGNEFVGSLGVSRLHNDWLGYRLGLRYRSSTPDEFNGVAQPNFGGKWLNLVPGVSVKASDLWSFRASGQIPLYRDVKGTQYTTTYSIALTIGYTLSRARSALGF
ncbi:MAG: hypothetical protein D6800_10480 [Candidatus Zixiibacteriota bacterium]|nr:MAG: hypothetical protein D6800_10480 [candidate division Zixibacteria bacterium]